MSDFLDRTEKLLGKAAVDKLARSSVLLFGLGGVGGYVLEGLVRSGVGRVGIVDNDTVSVSNINRQVIALRDNVGKEKTEVAKARANAINPDCVIETYNMFFMPDTANEIDYSKYDYIIDAIDTVKGKLEIIKKADENNIPVISSMGTGNKTDPSKLSVTDISKTVNDPLARVIRRELKTLGIKKLKVVYSEEIPSKIVAEEGEGRHAPASVAYIPAIAGMMIAGEVIRDLIKEV